MQALNRARQSTPSLPDDATLILVGALHVVVGCIRNGKDVWRMFGLGGAACIEPLSPDHN